MSDVAANYAVPDELKFELHMVAGAHAGGLFFVPMIQWTPAIAPALMPDGFVDKMQGLIGLLMFLVNPPMEAVPKIEVVKR